MVEVNASATPRPMFDLAALDIVAPAEKGVELQLKHPSGAIYRTSTGEPVMVRLAGRYSSQARACLKRIEERLVDLRAKGRGTNEDIEEEHNTWYLTACTLGWNIEALDGQPFLVTPANVEKLWTDARFFWLRRAALNQISDDASFLPLPT